jgi:hypothetical protein
MGIATKQSASSAGNNLRIVILGKLTSVLCVRWMLQPLSVKCRQIATLVCQMLTCTDNTKTGRPTQKTGGIDVRLFTEPKKGWSRGVIVLRHCVPNYLWSFPPILLELSGSLRLGGSLMRTSRAVMKEMFEAGSVQILETPDRRSASGEWAVLLRDQGTRTSLT